jgi:RNA polymerase sigma-70 factor, ECF subfamily
MDITEITERDDRQEMSRLADGDETALDRLMERHAQRLYHYLFRLLQNAAEAEDLAQETFVRVFRHAQRFDPAHRFLTWLFAIATNLVRDRARRLARHTTISIDTPLNDTGSTLRDVLPGHEPSPAEHTLRQEQAEAVREAIARLPNDLRIPLVLAEYESLSQAAIAAITGGTPKAVEMRLYRARRLLRQRLAHLLAS